MSRDNKACVVATTFGAVLVALAWGHATLAFAATGDANSGSVRRNNTVSLSTEVGHPNFMSPHASPIVKTGDLVFVVNTPADTVDVIDASTLAVVARVNVGIDPVGIAKRPDTNEVWVTNHVSDSVSVIDTDPSRPTYLQVIATVQDFDPITRATRFDEPVGIAFANRDKVYVALSSGNSIAVINGVTRQVDKRLTITAQDPRAITVRGDRLYVIPFESNNQTQISGCSGDIDGDLCTFDAVEQVLIHNNVLSWGLDVDIIKNPAFPDRDLYIFDTTTDELVEVVDTLGTLLYGLTVDSSGRVFVAQTDARNDINGRAGTLGHGLAEMENRAFLNQITSVDCSGVRCDAPQIIDLEPLPPAHPAPGMALATPFAIQISDDDSILVVSSAGSNKLFTVDAASGAVLGRVDVDAVPRGIALESAVGGGPSRAWVLNAVANTVSLVDVSVPESPKVVATIALADPTHPAVKRGRMAFNNANASTTRTFSCESCHPDGHTDQLLWILDTPICSAGPAPCDEQCATCDEETGFCVNPFDRGCTQIPPRITMPIRGLRDTAPYHWDGIPGDPYGGNNTANIEGNDPPNCSAADPASCTLVVVDGGLASTMRMVGDATVNDEGKPGELSGADRNDMATFMLSIPYPPSQERSYTNVLSNLATRGFEEFHIPGSEGRACGSCHRMPFWTSTNTPNTGMDAPTWRGAYDRWLILPQGRLNVLDLIPQPVQDAGLPEQDMWINAPDPRWQMVLEGSTGFSGSFARSVTLNALSANAAMTSDLLDALELSASEGGIVLQGEGVFIDGATSTGVSLQFEDGAYVERDDDEESWTRSELIAQAADALFVGTITARLGINVGIDSPQPAVWSLGPLHEQSGIEEFPMLTIGPLLPIPPMIISARHVADDAHLFVDGRRVRGDVNCQSGELPNCEDETIVVQLDAASDGVHFLQIQNPGGLFSNDFLFHVENDNQVDLFDVQFLIDCFDDPQRLSVPSCDPADLDGDGDIDLADYARLMLIFTG